MRPTEDSTQAVRSDAAVAPAAVISDEREELRAQVAKLRRAISERDKQIEAVKEIGSALSSILELDTVLELIMEKVTQLMGADRSTLFLVDNERGQIWSKIAQGDNVEEIRLPLGQGVAGWVAETGETVIIDDAYGDPRFQPAVDKDTGFITRNMLVLPMRAHSGRIIGVVQVLNKHEGAFDRDDERLLSAITAQATVSIENSLLYEGVLRRNQRLAELTGELEDKIRELDLLFDVERALSGSNDVDQLCGKVLRRTMAAIDTEGGAVLLEEGAGTERRNLLHYRIGQDSDGLNHVRLPVGQGVAGWVAQRGESALVNDARHDSRYAAQINEQTGFEARAVLAVPLMDEGEPFGAIELMNPRGRQGFDEDDLKVLTLLAGQVSRAVREAREREEKEKAGRLSAIGQALSGILHDFRTPMSIIHGYVQLLAAEEEPEMRSDYAGQVIRQIDTLNGMTREIMAFARGKSEVLIRKTYLHKLIADLRELLSTEFRNRGIELKVEDDYDGVAFLDEQKFTRLVFNLARNAAEAMPQGGTFTMKVSREDPWIRFHFRDTGSGVPEEIRERLFDSFVTQGKAHGTGLGLAIVKKVVEQHRGRIEFESSPEGTSFVVSIPAEHDPSRAELA